MKKSEILELAQLYSQNVDELIDLFNLNADKIFAEDLLFLLTPKAVQKFRQALIQIVSIYEGVESDLEESVKEFSTYPNKDRVLRELKRVNTVNPVFPEYSFAYHKIQKMQSKALLDVVYALYLIPENREEL